MMIYIVEIGMQQKATQSLKMAAGSVCEADAEMHLRKTIQKVDPAKNIFIKIVRRFSSFTTWYMVFTWGEKSSPPHTTYLFLVALLSPQTTRAENESEL